MTTRERLDEIRALMRQHEYTYADMQAGELYEDFIWDRVKLTEDEWNELFLYINAISYHVYG